MGRHKDLIISASQIKSWNSCQRQWWLKRIARVTQVPGHQLTYGTVVDEVINRYMEADDTGRDSKGNIVDLYPYLWHIDFNNMDFLDDSEMDRVQALIKMGIEKGIIARSSGDEVQEKLWREVRPGVKIVGYVDILQTHLRTVQDNKTSKAKKWALSEAKLAQDIQMRIYAAELLLRLKERSEPLPDKIHLVHNYFIKTGKVDVFKRHASVTVSEILETWAEVEETAAKMLVLYKRGLNGYTFKDIPAPESSASCNAYGGCPYIGICYRNEPLEQCIQRVNRIMEKRRMGLFDEMKKKGIEPKDTDISAENQDTNTPSAPSPEPESEAKAPDSGSSSPPWADPECVACEGDGFNTKGNPCAFCISKARDTKKPLPSQCEQDAKGNWQVMKEESAKPKPKKGKTKGLEDALGETKPKTEKAKGDSKPEKKNDAKPKSPSSKPKGSEPSGKRGRPPQGITLCINTFPISAGSRDVVTLDSIMDQLKEAVAIEEDTPFYQINAFKRRDMMAMVVHKALDDLGPVFLVCTNPDPDMMAVLGSVKSYVAREGYGGTTLVGTI